MVFTTMAITQENKNDYWGMTKLHTCTCTSLSVSN